MRRTDRPYRAGRQVREVPCPVAIQAPPAGKIITVGGSDLHIYNRKIVERGAMGDDDNAAGRRLGADPSR